MHGRLLFFANFSPENCPSTNSHDGFDNYCENLASKRGIYTKQIQLVKRTVKIILFVTCIIIILYVDKGSGDE